jgi:hypothetical protein
MAVTVKKANNDSETVFVEEPLLLGTPTTVTVLEEPVFAVVAVPGD